MQLRIYVDHEVIATLEKSLNDWKHMLRYHLAGDCAKAAANNIKRHHRLLRILRENDESSHRLADKPNTVE